MYPRDVPTGYIPDSQHYSYVPSEMYVPAGTSIPQTEGGEQEQLGSSSDSEEEDVAHKETMAMLPVPA